ncbi:MAG TPA: 50S ribosomal protein L36, partial [Burkholderiales bacterium]
RAQPKLFTAQVVRRKGVVRVICADPRHKQRQG